MKNANRDGLSYRKGVLVVAGLWACFTLSAAAPQDVPPLMKAAAGAAISSSAEWERLRRPEILKTFETQVFGVRPVERPKSVERPPWLAEHNCDGLLPGVRPEVARTVLPVPFPRWICDRFATTSP